MRGPTSASGSALGRRLQVSAAALALLAAASPPLPRAEAGRTAAGTLKRPIGARAIAMAESFAAPDGGLDSVGFNPAGLSRMKRPALQTSYSHGAVDDRFSFGGYAHPLPWGVVSAGFLYYDAGTIALNLSDGTRDNRKAQQDMAALAGLSLPLPAGFSAGGLAKVYRLELAEEARAAGYALDAGLIWHAPVKGVNLGASLQNLGPDVKFEQEGDPLPLTSRLGAAYLLELGRHGPLDSPYTFTKFLATADAIQVRGEKIAAGLGFEMYMPLAAHSHAALRAGYLFNRDLDAFSLGLGFKDKRFIMDYALGVRRALNKTHHVTLGVQF